MSYDVNDPREMEKQFPEPTPETTARTLPYEQVRAMFRNGLNDACARALSMKPGQDYLTMMPKRARAYFAEELISFCMIQNAHLEALRRISRALGDPFVTQPTKTAVDLADLAVAAIEVGITLSKVYEAEKNNNRLVEMTLAYEAAADRIASNCAPIHQPFAEDDEWFDLDNVDEMAGDMDAEAAYLDSRRLLQHHHQNPRWVMILDEAEPLPAPTATAPAAEQAGK